MKFKIGDILIRNNKQLLEVYESDPRKIRIIDYASMENLDLINGYKIKDIINNKVEDASYEYVEYYYSNRKEKLKKLNKLSDSLV